MYIVPAPLFILRLELNPTPHAPQLVPELVADLPIMEILPPAVLMLVTPTKLMPSVFEEAEALA